MDLKHSATFITIGALLLGAAVFTGWKPEDSRFDKARNIVLMREIGHTLLLQSGDSSSRVLSVAQTAADEYQLRFETSWSFIPDSLVGIVKRVVAAGRFPKNYVVNVLECTSNEVVFGYAILANEKKQTVACLGRVQPENCYYINIGFQDLPAASQKNKWIAASAIFALFLLSLITVLARNRKKQPVAHQNDADVQKTEGLPIGKYYLLNDELKLDGQTIPLSVKEAKLLSIFAASPNQVIDRSRLQKEGWEDEGVIVGRSLDVFISKLRKKLEDDPSVKLVNIHGKGYKLEIVESNS